MKSNKIIFIAGGGTGGHIFPALAIGDRLKEKGFNILYIGSKYGIEKTIYKKNKLNFFLLNIGGIQRSKNLRAFFKNLFFPIKFILSYILSIYLILKHKPLAIIGTGGYCSGLPLLAAITFKIPSFIQDQNSIPGLITKQLNNKVNCIFLGYEHAAKTLNNKRCIYTGNPIRKELETIDKSRAKKELNFDLNKKLILILGGSQGAEPLNIHFKNHINFYIKNNFQLLWQCGENKKNNLDEIKDSNIIIKQFIQNMSLAYSASDLVIARSGAMVISELTLMGKAMILIPYPHAAENHQYYNASFLETNKACLMINQNNLKNGNLESCVKNIFNNIELIKELEKNSKKLSMPKAAENITDEILRLIPC